MKPAMAMLGLMNPATKCCCGDPGEVPSLLRDPHVKSKDFVPAKSCPQKGLPSGTGAILEPAPRTPLDLKCWLVYLLIHEGTYTQVGVPGDSPRN